MAEQNLWRWFLGAIESTISQGCSYSDQKQLSFLPTSLQAEKAMAPHSSTLAWKIPWMEEPGGLQSVGSRRVGHDWATSLSRTGEGNGNPLQCSCLENPRDGGAWWAAVCGVAQSQTWLKRLSSSSSSLLTLLHSQNKTYLWSEFCLDWGLMLIYQLSLGSIIEQFSDTISYRLETLPSFLL